MSTITAGLSSDARAAYVPLRSWTAPRSRRPARRVLGRRLIAFADLAAVAVAIALTSPDALEAVVYGTTLGLVVLAPSRRPPVRLDVMTELPRHVAVVAVTLLVLGVVESVLLAGFGLGDGVTSTTVLAAASALPLVVTGRVASYRLLRAMRRRRIVREPVLLIGADEVGASIARTLRQDLALGMEPVGFVDDVDPAGAPTPLLGELTELDHVIEQQSVRRVIVAFAVSRDGDVASALRTVLRRGVEVYVVPRLHELGRDRGCTDESLPWVSLQRLRPAASVRATWRAKRAFDVAVAGTALVVVSPLLLLLALGVKLSGPGPVLFRQQRVGQFGRVFEVLKFRSLRVNVDSDVRWSVAADARQTRLGAWMRRFSVDELPQLWNVLRGDMSLVGPRPERPHFVEAFGAVVPGYDDRHRLPVGLTGWAQVHGLRGDTSIPERARYDNHYIDHWSLLGDLSIIVATISAVVRDGRRKPSA